MILPPDDRREEIALPINHIVVAPDKLSEEIVLSPDENLILRFEPLDRADEMRVLTPDQIVVTSGKSRDERVLTLDQFDELRVLPLDELRELLVLPVE